MKKILSVFTFLLLALSLSATEKLPVFRYVSGAPFAKSGNPIGIKWKNTDILHGFVQSRGIYDIAVDQTTVSGLFDEKNLYLTIRGMVKPQFNDERKGKSLFQANNFEIFIQPKAGGEYMQLAVDDKGRLYTAYGREETKISGVKAVVKKGKNFWMANLTIPFADLKMDSPKADKEIRFCVMRTNFCTWNKKEEVSAYTPLEWNNHLPDLWAKVVMSRKAGKAKRIMGPTNSVQVNLAVNGEFNIPFNTSKNVLRTETMAMSGEWIIRATGPVYQFYQFRPFGFAKNTEYTLRIKARNIGGDGNLRIVQLKRRNGKVSEGHYLAMNLSLGPDFHEYFLPFKTSSDEPWTIVVYKVGGKRPGTGVEVASVKFYKGKISAFEIRKLGRAGNQKVAAGTTPAKETNIYGKTAKALNVLCIVNNKYGLREPLDIFNGTDVKYHTLVTTGKTAQDIYETDDTPAEIQDFLAKQKYDVYMIGNSSLALVGKELYGKILAAVKKGAGLYVGAQRNTLRYRQLVKDVKAKTLTSNALETTAFPVGMYRFNTRDKAYGNAGIRKGSIGKGNVLVFTNPKTTYGQPFLVKMHGGDVGKNLFPLDKYTSAYILRTASLLAGKKEFFNSVDVKDGKLVLSSTTIPAGTPLKICVVDKHGNKVLEKNGKFTSPASSIAIPVTSTGKHFVSVLALDKAGKTIDYTGKTFEKKGAFLASFTSKETHTSKEKATFKVKVEGLTSGMTIDWTLSDFSGRILEKGSFAAKKENTFSAPLNAFYTNMAKLVITLKKGGKLVDSIRENVFIRDLDKKRIYDDYTVAVWPGNGTQSAAKELDEQLEKIGIRHYMIPLQGATATLSAGFASGTSWIGGGDTFCGWPQKSNIRAQQFNTAKTRANFAKRADKAYKDYYKYGVVQSAICDEPNFSSPHANYELDAHPENLAVYRQRLEKKFGTIANYNKRHRTNHKSFADINQTLLKDARASKNYSEFVQWRSFNVDRWCEIIKVFGDAGKRIDPDAKLSLMNSFGQTVFSGNDYWKLLTKAGLNVSNEYTSAVYFGKSPINNFDEFYRSFRPDMRVWGFIGYFYTKATTDLAPWFFGLHRFGGFTWYCATSWGYNLVDNPSGALTTWGKDLKETLEDSKILKGIGKIFTDYPWRKNSIGIYYSHESMLLSYALGKELRNSEINQNSPVYNYYYSRQGIQYLLEELLHQYEYLSSEQINNGILKNYKVLFLPRILTISDKEVKILKEFAAKGGKLVADVMPGMYDELGTPRAKAPFTSKEITIIGKNFSELDKAQKVQFAKLLADAKVAPILSSPGIENYTGREAMHFVKGNMNIYAVLRTLGRSKDEAKQTFIFPTKGRHLYDIRKGKYLGKKDSVTLAVPNGNAVVFGHYPYKVEDLVIRSASKVKAGKDLTAKIAIKPSNGKAGDHVFHIEVLDPAGKGRFHMKRNVSAPNGKYDFTFRMAHNDQKGKWTLKVTDAMTGMSKAKTFVLE